jgi:hypothetical protein
LINAGAALWRGLVPERLREQFWERQHRIRQLTILADRDAVPWELLYPLDPGHDEGFLVEQFPVSRAIFGRRPIRRLSLRPARFVLPEGSPPEASDEIEALRQLLASERQFTPTLLTTAAIGQVLATTAPTVFINACRTAGLAATYNQLDGWASKFLEAGAGAFIGTLWAVSDGTAREFASELYAQLQAGLSLGYAAMRARQTVASQPGDPSWLAYTVYGDPRATISR